MTPDQLERYNIYRRSGLNKTAIKKVRGVLRVGPFEINPVQVAANSDHQMSNGVAQLMSGVGKVFVGEIIAKGTRPTCILKSG